MCNRQPNMNTREQPAGVQLINASATGGAEPTVWPFHRTRFIPVASVLSPQVSSDFSFTPDALPVGGKWPPFVLFHEIQTSLFHFSPRFPWRKSEWKCLIIDLRSPCFWLTQYHSLWGESVASERKNGRFSFVASRPSESKIFISAFGLSYGVVLCWSGCFLCFGW